MDDEPATDAPEPRPVRLFVSTRWGGVKLVHNGFARPLADAYLDDVRRLNGEGCNDSEIGRRLGLTRNQVMALRRRNDIPAAQGRGKAPADRALRRALGVDTPPPADPEEPTSPSTSTGTGA